MYVCASTYVAVRDSLHLFHLFWQRKPGRPPPSVLTLSVVSECKLDVVSSLLWKYLGKLWSGKCVKERIIMKESYKALF